MPGYIFQSHHLFPPSQKTGHPALVAPWWCDAGPHGAMTRPSKLPKDQNLGQFGSDGIPMNPQGRINQCIRHGYFYRPERNSHGLSGKRSMKWFTKLESLNLKVSIHQVSKKHSAQQFSPHFPGNLQHLVVPRHRHAPARANWHLPVLPVALPTRWALLAL